MLNRNAGVIVISSVSGGGKTTLIRRLTERYPELKVAVTATSRPPREGEVWGDHYYFYSPEEFRSKIEAGEFLEYALVHGNYYGVPAAPVRRTIEEGRSVILNIDVQGMRNVKKIMGEKMVSIFLLPPDRKTWEERLRNRGSDPEEEILRRLEEGERELESAGEFAHRVVNDILERAVEEVVGILRDEGVVES